MHILKPLSRDFSQNKAEFKSPPEGSQAFRLTGFFSLKEKKKKKKVEVQATVIQFY